MNAMPMRPWLALLSIYARILFYALQSQARWELRARLYSVASIIAALEIQIPLNEANLARLVAPDNLEAWSLYHLGLQHLHRFNRRDNLAAQAHFERAIAKEPRFARAHAGLSSTWFQSAFLRYSDNPARDVGEARRFGERSVELVGPWFQRIYFSLP